jgi:hypothetical protein
MKDKWDFNNHRKHRAPQQRNSIGKEEGKR